MTYSYTPNQTSAVPEYLDNEKEHRRQIARTVNSAVRGKLNCTTDVTLNASATSTVIQDARIGSSTAFVPGMAMTSAGAAAIAAGIYCDTLIPAVGKQLGSITIHHASNASTTQTIRFLLLG